MALARRNPRSRLHIDTDRDPAPESTCPYIILYFDWLPRHGILCIESLVKIGADATVVAGRMNLDSTRAKTLRGWYRFE